MLGHVQVRSRLSEDEAAYWLTRLPHEVVSGTAAEHSFRNRRVAKERITGVLASAPELVDTPLGRVRMSADGWGFGLYDDDHRYWFSTPLDRTRRDDPEWIQAGGLPVVTERTLVWIGLNPSTSDDSPTARRATLSKVVKWAEKLEMQEVLGVNLFAYRHTDPKQVIALARKDGPRAVGTHNDRVLDHVLTGRGTVLAAWGTQGERLGRGASVRGRITNGLCLGTCLNGEPKHPARLAQATVLVDLP